VWLQIAVLLAAYAQVPTMPTTPEREPMLMIEPVPCARIAPMACLHPEEHAIEVALTLLQGEQHHETPSYIIVLGFRHRMRVGCTSQ
jgi:hypothetical protein